MVLTVSTSENYLYHYTNVSSLAMILKNRSIRFTPLPLLDDKEEQMHNDSKNYSKYVFVSSWTDADVESIPMWKMYTSPIEGVRIKLPKYPFRNYKLTQESVKGLIEESVKGLIDIKDTDGLDTVVPVEELLNSNYMISTYMNKHLLIPVEYTDDPNKLVPQIVHSTPAEMNIKLGQLGKCKNKYWDFQHEWRYVLRFLPISLRNVMLGKDDEEVSKVNNCLDLPFNYYFLKLDDEKFKEMEITLSPQINDGNREIVKLLIEKYNPGIKINESLLFGKI